MLHKTQGIVLKFIKYRESSIIAQIFTELFGLQSYIINTVRVKSARTTIALFQPLTILDLVVYHKEHASINRISEVRCGYPYKTIYKDVTKTAIILFLDEMLVKTIKEESNVDRMFEFIMEALIDLDLSESRHENFHLYFLTQLARRLGFLPGTAKELTAEFSSYNPVSDQEVVLLNQLIACKDFHEIRLSADERKRLLAHLMVFFRHHIENMGEIKSIRVLQEVLN